MQDTQKLQIRQILDDTRVSRFKDSVYLSTLKKRYRHFVRELEYVEEKMKQSSTTSAGNLDWESIHHRVLQDVFVASQNLEIAQNLEREWSTHLYFQFCTDSFIQVIQSLQYEKKTITLHSLILTIAKQKETYSAKLLQKLGSLEMLEKDSETPTLLTPVAIAPSGLEILRESLKWARKLNWTRLSTEHLLWVALIDPQNTLLNTLKKSGAEIYPILRSLKNFLDIQEESYMKPFEPQEMHTAPAAADEQTRLLRDIRDLLREQGKRSGEQQRKFLREEKTFKGILLALNLLLLVLALYTVGLVFLYKQPI